MKKFKKYSGFIIILVLAVILAILLLFARCSKQEDVKLEETVSEKVEKDTDKDKETKKETYKYVVTVQGTDGKGIQSVFVAMFDESGDILGMPLATNVAGKAVFEYEEEKDYSAAVISAPLGYRLDTTRQTFAEDNRNITITLDMDNSGNVARIGSTYYFTLSEAITAANASSTDVVIELLGDAYVTQISIKNEHNRKITINGNGHSIVTRGTSNAIEVYQESGVVEFNNMSMYHGSTAILIRTRNPITLNMTDVDIYTINDVEGAYKFALINVSGLGTSHANLTRVNVDMTSSYTPDSKAGVIRTGNSGEEKTVYITLNDCNFDLAEATGRTGIMVMKEATTYINLTNTKIATKDTFAIRPDGESVVHTNCTFTSLDPYYTENPIEGYDVKIGNTVYTMDQALAIATASKEDVTITLLRDITCKVTYDITGDTGNKITINGDGHTVTTTGSNRMFTIKKTAGTFAIQNMKVEHQATNRFMRIDTGITIDFVDVDIVAENIKEKTKDAVISYNIAGNAEADLNLTRTNIKLKNSTNYKDDHGYHSGVILTGQEQSAHKKTLNITMVDSNITVADGCKAPGICITYGTTANIKMTDSKITTSNNYAVYARARFNDDGSFRMAANVSVLLENSKLVSKNASYNNATYDGLSIGYSVADNKKPGLSTDGINTISLTEAMIGDTYYGSLAEALAVAVESEEDVTIKLIRNVTTSATTTISGDSGNTITIDGNGHTFTTTGSNRLFTVTKSGGSVVFKDMTIEHQSTNMFLRIDTSTAVEFVDVAMNATNNTDGAYKNAVIGFNMPDNGDEADLSLIRTTITVENDYDGTKNDHGYQSGVILTGSEESADEKTVNLTMVDSEIVVSGDAQRPGVCITYGTTANINLTNSNITTENNYAVYARARFNTDGSLRKAACANVVLLDNSTLVSTNAAYNNPAYDGLSIGYSVADNKTSGLSADGINTIALTEAMIGDTYYGSLSAALSAAVASEEDVTITLLKNASASATTEISGSHGNKITIDGSGYTFATTGSNRIFTVTKTGGSVVFKNMTIDHQSTNMFLRIDTSTTVEFADVTMNATNKTNGAYKNAVIGFNMPDDGNEANLKLTKTTITVENDYNGTKNDHGYQCGVILTGSEESSDEKIVNLTMVDSKIKVSGDAARPGVCITYGTTANINLTNSSITTENNYAVYARARFNTDGSLRKAAYANVVLLDNSTLLSENTAYNNAAYEGKSVGYSIADNKTSGLSSAGINTITVSNRVETTNTVLASLLLHCQQWLLNRA